MKNIFNYLLIILLALLFGCKTQQVATKPNVVKKPVPHQVLLDRLFGYEPTIDNFKKNIIPPYKIKKYSVINKHNTNIRDTIYKFYYKKSVLFIYKSKYGKEMFFAGKITDSKIVLNNDIKIGIPRNEFFGNFTDLKFDSSDTINLTLKEKMMNFRFVFNKNRLEAIKMDAYID